MSRLDFDRVNDALYCVNGVLLRHEDVNNLLSCPLHGSNRLGLGYSKNAKRSWVHS